MQVTLAIGKQSAPHLLHRAAMPHGGQGVEKGQPRPLVIANIACGHERHPGRAAHCRTPTQAVFVVALQRHLRHRNQPIPKHITPLTDRCAGIGLGIGILHANCRDCRQRHAREQSFGVGGNVVEREHARVRAGIVRHTVNRTRGSGRALLPPGNSIAVCQQPAEMGIARAVGRPHDQRHGIHRLQMRPDDELDTFLPGADGLRGNSDLLGCTVRPHNAGKRGAVGDGDRLVAERVGFLHQFLGVRAALQERKITRAVQLCIGRSVHRYPPSGCFVGNPCQENVPCRNHSPPSRPTEAPRSRRKIQ